MRVVYFTVLIGVTLGNVLNFVIYAKHTKSTQFFSHTLYVTLLAFPINRAYLRSIILRLYSAARA